MRLRRRIPSVWLLLCVAAGATLAASRAAEPPYDLLSIRSGATPDRPTLLIETSAPVAYSSQQPDPFTVIVELRNVRLTANANQFTPLKGGRISAIVIEENAVSPGIPVTRIRMDLKSPAEHQVRSSLNLITVELDPIAGAADPATPLMAPAVADGAPAPAAVPPLPGAAPEAAPASPAAAPGDASEVDLLATQLTEVLAERTADGVAIRLRGNGALNPAYVGPVGSDPPRLMIDLPGVRSVVPDSIPIEAGPVRRVRVALNSRAPLVTRVVLDLARPAEYRVVPPDVGQPELVLVVQEDRSTDEVPSAPPADSPLLSPSADPEPVLPVEPSTRNVVVLDPIAALDVPADPEPEPEPEPLPPGAPVLVSSVPEASTISPASAAPAPAPPDPVSTSGAETPAEVQPVAAVLAPAQAAAPMAIEPSPMPAPVVTASPAQDPMPVPPPPQPVPQPVQPPPSPVVPAEPGTGGGPYTGHPVTLDFQNADLRAVLRTFSEISGLNLVIDPTVQGTVDVSLRDVPWDQALDIILRANKLGYTVDGTVVRIAPLTVLADEEAQRRKLAEEQALSGELQVLTRTLSYARAANLAQLVTRTALSPRGTVQVDERTNTLIITDLPERLTTASDLIGTLDRPEPQVEIEARVVQTNREFARVLGVQWGVNGRIAPELGNTTGLVFPNRGNVSGRTGAVQAPPDPRAGAFETVGTAVNLGVEAATSAIGVALGSINGAFNLDVALSALERSGQGRVLSTPRVTTQNNVPAEVTQGIQIPIQTVANNTVTVTFKDAALSLRVTPQITSVGTVIMRIELENASPDFTRSVNGIPPIDTQRALTQVQVDNGATTVIGGIFVSREQSVTDRTPFLHRIPLLGWLFKRDDLRDESRELLIFITPRIRN